MAGDAIPRNTGDLFDPVRFGENLRRLRGDQTQRELEKRTGVSNAYLSQLENGQVEPGVVILIQLAAGLGVGIEELLAGAASAAVDIRCEACPHCESTHAEIQQEYRSKGTVCFVECRSCGARGPVIDGPQNGDCTDRQVARAIMKWNQRI
jgi:transcriptional regulator with XRE-family HTH domain